MSSVAFLPNAQALLAVVNASPAKPQTECQCSLQRCAGWESVTETEWPSQHLRAVATLRDPEVYEPTFEEHHPHGTRYDSPEAPVSVKHFPYNRCEVLACTRCQQHVLRYTEFGGYYVDPRARRLNAATVCEDLA